MKGGTRSDSQEAVGSRATITAQKRMLLRVLDQFIFSKQPIMHLPFFNREKDRNTTTPSRFKGF